MNLAGFLDSLKDVVGVRPKTEVNCNGMLTGRDIDDRRRRCEKSLVLCEVGYTKCGRHDDKAEGL